MAWTQAKTKKLGHLLIPIVLLLSCTLIFIDLPIMERLELKALDLLFWIRGEQKPQGHVVIVTIDEKTIRAWGRWPPPRARMADLVNHLSARGAKVILFDIIFSEKELVMETKGPGEEEVFSPGDLAFKEAIKRAGNVVLPFVLDVPTTYQTVSEFSKEIPETIQFSTYGRVKKGALLRDAPQAIGALPPLALFGDVAGALGHVYTLPDKDGVLRRDQLVVKYGEDYYPTMTLQATRLDLGLSEMEMELKMGEGVRLGKIEIPTDEIGRMLIDYFGKEKTFPYYSAADVVAGQTAPNLFDGKIALIGASAMATADS
ncbi:MAG: CHASE2 domain-containing protein, partial [Nitrospirae bacterium]|nr:CHASE2 domain-containing protein [Candidatus Troglogloeales bacterium]